MAINGRPPPGEGAADSIGTSDAAESTLHPTITQANTEPIGSIVIGERHRKDMGDLDALAAAARDSVTNPFTELFAQMGAEIQAERIRRMERIHRGVVIAPRGASMAKSYWRGISTPHEVRRNPRRLNPKNHNAEDVLAQMRAGARLLLHYHKGQPTWLLNPGGEVAAKMAADVIKHIDVYAVGDTLFVGGMSQTYRFVG